MSGWKISPLRNPSRNIISSKHQDKLRRLANKSGVTADRALRNIVNYLNSINDNTFRPDYFKEFITAKDIERMIDLIAC